MFDDYGVGVLMMPHEETPKTSMSMQKDSFFNHSDNLDKLLST